MGVRGQGVGGRVSGVREFGVEALGRRGFGFCVVSLPLSLFPFPCFFPDRGTGPSLRSPRLVFWLSAWIVGGVTCLRGWKDHQRVPPERFGAREGASAAVIVPE